MKIFNVKHKLAILTGLASILALAAYLYSHSSNAPYPPVYEHGEINKQIIAVAQLQQSKSNVLPDPKDLSAWNSYLQKYFLRPPGTDHHDLMQITENSDRDRYLSFFTKLGMVKDIMPSKQSYDVVFVYGGSPDNTFQRFNFLSENIKNKKLDVRANKKIYYINGLRKIHSTEVAEAKNLGVTCEYQHICAKLIWDAHFKHLPLELEIMTIQPPSEKRANTDDTLKSFYASLASNKLYVLGYSNAPYVPYQADTAKAVAIREHKTNLEIEVVGGRNHREMPTIAYLDSLARRVYTFYELNSN